MRRPSGTDTGTGTGAGKSHLLIALGTEAAVAGYRVKYVLATKLVNARGKRHPVAVFTTARSAGRCHDADGAAALHYTRRPTPCAADAPEQAAHGPAPGEPVAAERGHQLPRRGSCSPDERGELRERGGGETGAPGSCGRQKNPERHRYSCASTTIGGGSRHSAWFHRTGASEDRLGLVCGRAPARPSCLLRSVPGLLTDVTFWG